MPRRKKPIPFPLDVLEGLAELGVTEVELAGLWGLAQSTVSERLSKPGPEREVWLRGQSKLKVSLRRSLVRQALESTNPASAIFLAKNFLGMSDRREVKTEIDQRIGCRWIAQWDGGSDAEIRSARGEEPLTTAAAAMIDGTAEELGDDD